MPIVIPIFLLLVVIYVGENIVYRLSCHWLMIIAGTAISIIIMRRFLYKPLLEAFSNDNLSVALLPTFSLCAALVIYYLLQEHFFSAISRSWPRFVTCFLLGLLVPWVIFLA
ncbi:MAG: hypothetical protein ABIH38_01910 [Patescibacteria group bacterium]